MKVADIKEPGLYWLVSNRSDDGTLAQVSEVLGSLYLERLGAYAEEPLEEADPEYLKDCEFIGPFPPPGEASKFETFKAALEALCQAYGVTLSVSGHGGLQVWDAGAFTGEPVHCAGMSDYTGHNGVAP